MRTTLARPDWLQVCLGCLLIPLVGSVEANERTAVESKSIASIGYNRSAKTLEIEFRAGPLYRYREVAESVVIDLLRAKSKGRYFAAHIRGKYTYEKVWDLRK